MPGPEMWVYVGVGVLIGVPLGALAMAGVERREAIGDWFDALIYGPAGPREYHQPSHVRRLAPDQSAVAGTPVSPETETLDAFGGRVHPPALGKGLLADRAGTGRLAPVRELSRGGVERTAIPPAARTVAAGSARPDHAGVHWHGRAW